VKLIGEVVLVAEGDTPTAVGLDYLASVTIDLRSAWRLQSLMELKLIISCCGSILVSVLG
jgi:hypothetical protein